MPLCLLDLQKIRLVRIIPFVRISSLGFVLALVEIGCIRFSFNLSFGYLNPSHGILHGSTSPLSGWLWLWPILLASPLSHSPSTCSFVRSVLGFFSRLEYSNFFSQSEIEFVIRLSFPFPSSSAYWGAEDQACLKIAATYQDLRVWWRCRRVSD